MSTIVVEGAMVFQIGNRTKNLKRRKGRRFVDISGELTIKIKRERACFVSYCPELVLSSHGGTVDESIQRLVEVIEIFFEEILKDGTLDEALKGCGWIKIAEPKPHWVPPAFIAEKRIPIQLSA